MHFIEGGLMSEHESEQVLENKLVQRFNGLGYKTVNLPDEMSLLSHFRQILNEQNIENLQHEPLTDSEFKRVLNELVGAKSHYQIARQLRGADANPMGKISIQRDNDETVYLTIFDGLHFENNQYEVAHQITVSGTHENRYDVTVLINGLPIVQVELKRRGVDFRQAFNQVVRYKSESMRGLFRFVQLFVISNGGETRYFANGDGDLNANFMFYWTDRENNWLNDLDAFSASFFTKERLHSLIAKYTIFDSAKERLMIMRPYQIYAVEAIIKQAQDHPDKNGFVWHTTGSGKTVTSFKASQLLARDTDAEKVIFLIDRSDLDIQTSKNFNSYMTAIPGETALDLTTNTSSLVKQLQSHDNALIVTTIQKMNNAVNNPKYKGLLTSYHDKRVVFIEDEAHRSQFGEMRKNVNKWFANSQHFGFTGTPIFSQNIGSDKRTTETLYDEELHRYLIKDAIRDHNVLGFNVEQMNTLVGKDDISDEDVAGIDTREAMESEARLDHIVTHIMLNHDNKTKKRTYNAILAVPNTELALRYYTLFQQKIKASHSDLKVTTVFTWTANEDSNQDNQGATFDTSRHGLDHVISDYNETYHTNFSTEDFKGYFNDISQRMKDHNAQTRDENIDILIVVGMFLTGFDSPRLSVLYTDKKLQWHSLIQAYSRTNRVEKDTKPFGSIVNYRNLKKATDDAITLFSAGDESSFYVKQYDELLGELNEHVLQLHKIVERPQDVDELYNQGDDVLSTFVFAFRDVMRTYNQIRVYDDFEWADVDSFTDQDLESFQGKYQEVYHQLNDGSKKDKTSILEDIDFQIDLLSTDRIDVQYIVNLVKAINLDNKDSRQADVNKIKRLLDKAATDELKSKADLIAAFLDEMLPTLQSGDNVGDSLNAYLAKRREVAVSEFAEDVKLPVNIIEKQIADTQFYGQADQNEMNKDLNNAGYGFKAKRDIKKRLKGFIQETIQRFTLV